MVVIGRDWDFEVVVIGRDYCTIFVSHCLCQYGFPLVSIVNVCVNTQGTKDIKHKQI